MGKKALERQLPANEAKAVVKHIRISAQKLNLVAQVIRGMDVASALTQLTFSSKRIAHDVKRALQSAVANAENNHNLNVDSLIVKEAYVGKNIVMKRMHTRGRGKSARIFKPFSNLTLIVCEKGEEPVKKAKNTKGAEKDAKAPAGKSKKQTTRQARGAVKESN